MANGSDLGQSDVVSIIIWIQTACEDYKQQNSFHWQGKNVYNLPGCPPATLSNVGNQSTACIIL